MTPEPASRPERRAASSLVLAMALAWAWHANGAQAGTCPPMIVGVDTSAFNIDLPVYDGSAYGQVFEAADTILQAVSVWRGPVPTNVPLRSYVVELDSTGTPDYNRILRMGPTLDIPNGDGVHPLRVRFAFEPPVILPGPGRYEFAVQVAPDPVCDGANDVVGDSLNPYPGGGAWRHIRTFPYCYLGPARRVPAGYDLIFELEFCDRATPVRRSSWGGIKLRYR